MKANWVPRVYISGPITKGDRNHNFAQAAVAEKQLMLSGFAPLNPMRSMIVPHSHDADLPHEVWMRADLPWVECAEAVLRLPGESVGATQECDRAKAKGIPVLHTIEALEDWRRRNGEDTSCPIEPEPLAAVVKESNPKDAVGVAKAPASTVPLPVLLEIGVAMLEGARKYGRHNYRAIGVRSSVYFDAAFRHLSAWWEGEDVDPDSGLSHITKAIATLAVLRDAMIRGKMVDDRPPGTAGFVQALNERAAAVVKRYPDAKAPFLATGPADTYTP